MLSFGNKVQDGGGYRDAVQERLSRRVNGRMDGQDGQGRAGSSLSRRHQQWELSWQFSAFDAHDRSPRASLSPWGLGTELYPGLSLGCSVCCQAWLC